MKYPYFLMPFFQVADRCASKAPALFLFHVLFSGKGKEMEYYITIEGQEIAVTEEIYRAYKRPTWAEHKRNDREKRCQVSDGKGGLKRCLEDCSICDRVRDGSILTLNELAEEKHVLGAGEMDVSDIVAGKILLEQLYKVLEEVDPKSLRVCQLIMEGHSRREIARILEIPQSSFEYQFKKLMESLKTSLGE